MSRLRPHPPHLKERGYKLYEEGKSNPEIAKQLGIPLATLARWSSKGKWKLRKQLASRPETELGTLAPMRSHDTLAEISQLTFVEKQARYTEMMSDHALRVAYTVGSLSPQGLLINADKISKLDSVARKALNLEESKPPVVVNVALLAQSAPPRLVIEAQKAPAAEGGCPRWQAMRGVVYGCWVRRPRL